MGEQIKNKTKSEPQFSYKSVYLAIIALLIAMHFHDYAHVGSSVILRTHINTLKGFLYEPYYKNHEGWEDLRTYNFDYKIDQIIETLRVIQSETTDGLLRGEINDVISKYGQIEGNLKVAINRYYSQMSVHNYNPVEKSDFEKNKTYMDYIISKLNTLAAHIEDHNGKVLTEDLIESVKLLIIFAGLIGFINIVVPKEA